ncbi:S-adenosyl-L-methionine-dependent methyltransferase [Gautieria morchelliformis]|nr:S-adenosyl-L-methionine-dependent methyltransferase [Gautieria morchelliformis]
MGSRSFHKTEEPYPLANDTPEWQRLDDMHNGINDFLGKKLSFAQIATPPKRILEIGAGSGAWAIQAAQTYPDAEVLAIDISPLPPRPLPENIKFQNVNVTQSLPFEPESFDIVHARFLLVHLPNFREVLGRFIELVRPGGWLLIDDIEHNLSGDFGPGIKKFYEVYHGYMKPRKVDPMAGPLIEPILKESGKFSEVHMRKAVASFWGKTGDPTLDHLGEVMRISFARAYQAFDPKLVAYGMTDEVKDGWFQEASDVKRNVACDTYFTWARKA